MISSADPRPVVVVGAGLAGAGVCRELRRQGFEGGLVLLGAEEHLPYDRPPLTKAVLLGKRDATPLGLAVDKLRIDFQPARSATGLDPARQVVETDGGPIAYQHLFVATGAEPIRLPGPGTQCTVRTIEDAHRLREQLVPGAHVVVVGASWIGAEVSTSALALGCTVTCVEAGTTPLTQALGAEVASRLLPWWAGVDLRLGVGVRSIEQDRVVLTSGDEIVADVVVVGVGVRPATAWLADSGLGADAGVPVDEYLRAAPGVSAVGDVAVRRSPRYGESLRLEHWDDAQGAAATAVAAALDPADPVPPYDPVPYFWSDQFGHRVQYLGHHDTVEHDVVVRTHADDDGEGWSVGWFDAGRRLTAMLLVDRAKELMVARNAVDRGAVASSFERFASGDLPLAEVLSGAADSTGHHPVSPSNRNERIEVA